MPTLISFRSKLLLVILDFWPISKKTLKILNCDRRQNSYLDMPRKRENFSQSNIDAAINGGLSKKAAAQKYGIPRSTLQHRLKNPNMKITCGPATVLTQDEEDLLQTWIIDSCRKGFPRRKEDLLNSVQKFLETNKRQNPFKNNLPGFGWYKAFMRRHPLISVRTSEHVTSASACISETDIKKWFSEVHLYLVENGLNEILEDPTRVFNGDETGFSLCLKNKTVLASKIYFTKYS